MPMPKLASSTNTPYHHGDLRKTLLTEAICLIREEGADALSMRNLASRAGVSRTAAYHHFKDKQDLLCAIAEQGFERILSRAQLVDQNGRGEISEEQLRRMVGNYLQFALTNSEYYDLMFGSQLWKTNAITEALSEKARDFFRFYVSVLQKWQDSGAILATVDLVRHTQVTMSTLHGMSRLLLDGIYVEKSTVTAIGDSAARMFWRELQPE